MKTDKLQDAIGLVKEEYLRETELSASGTQKTWITWAAIAAGIVITGVGAFFAVTGIRNNQAAQTAADESRATEKAVVEEAITEEEAAFGFTLSDQQEMTYFPISFAERVRFNLVPEGAVGLSEENTYQIQAQDLGEVMGTVTDCADASLIGRTVYHFASYPDSRAICILEHDGAYDFYCAEYLAISVKEDDLSDAVFASYGFPGNCASIEVQDKGGMKLFTITDEAVINEIITMMSGCGNIGDQEASARRIQLWKDTYGNDDVYYDEEQKMILFRSITPEESSYTDANGVTVTEYHYPEGYQDPYDLAHQLWSEGERYLVMEAKDGLNLYVDYFPALGLFYSQNASFGLSEEQIESLNGIFGN